MTSIDHLQLQSVRPGLDYINSLYQLRHAFIKGDSNDVLSSGIIRQFYDCILIDGSFKYETVYKDIELCKKYAHRDTILIINNVLRNKQFEKYWTKGPSQAWHEMLNNEFINKIDQIDYKTGNGIAIAKYNFS